MGGLLAYSGIITKIKAMSKNLLMEDDYEKIISFGSVSEIITFLKEHEGYRDIFQNVDVGIHRGDIEHELIHSLQLSYAKIFRFANIRQRKAIQIFFCRFEVAIIKLCLQGILKDESGIDLSLFQDFFERHSKLDINAIMNQDTVEGLVEALKGTDYYRILKKVESIAEPTLFDYETRLDIYYFERVWKMKDKYLSKKENEAYTDIMGKNIDLLNLVWIYRFKTYFDTDNGKILRSIIPIHYKLSKEMVSQLVAAENASQLRELIAKGPYRKLFPEGITPEKLEAEYQKYLYKVYRVWVRTNPISIIPIEYFLYLKERELDKLTTALECVRYRLPAERSLAILEKL